MQSHIGILANYRTELNKSDKSRMVITTDIVAKQEAALRFAGTTIELNEFQQNDAEPTSK